MCSRRSYGNVWNRVRLQTHVLSARVYNQCTNVNNMLHCNHFTSNILVLLLASGAQWLLNRSPRRRLLIYIKIFLSTLRSKVIRIVRLQTAPNGTTLKSHLTICIPACNCCSTLFVDRVFRTILLYRNNRMETITTANERIEVIGEKLFSLLFRSKVARIPTAYNRLIQRFSNSQTVLLGTLGLRKCRYSDKKKVENRWTRGYWLN